MSHAIMATQNRWVIVETSDKMWSTRQGNGNLSQYSCLKNPMKGMKSLKDKTSEDELTHALHWVAMSCTQLSD